MQIEILRTIPPSTLRQRKLKTQAFFVKLLAYLPFTTNVEGRKTQGKRKENARKTELFENAVFEKVPFPYGLS